MDQSPQTVWNECLDLVRENISRQSFKTWFEPLTAVKLEEEQGHLNLTVQLPSRFYYEWLEEHYFGLLRKTITRVLGPQGRLYYHIGMEREDPDSSGENASPEPRGAELPVPRPTEQRAAPVWPRSAPMPAPGALPQSGGYAGAPANPYAVHTGPDSAPVHPFAIPGIRKAPVVSQL
ncbi:MAG TPA: DnaA N-terminal domain-containing protein, partial [Rhodothermales bacterium]|nr:DnaA N-terminal domain-containing protein [Rhodothermales bacterium]